MDFLLGLLGVVVAVLAAAWLAVFVYSFIRSMRIWRSSQDARDAELNRDVSLGETMGRLIIGLKSQGVEPDRIVRLLLQNEVVDENLFQQAEALDPDLNRHLAHLADLIQCGAVKPDQLADMVRRA